MGKRSREKWERKLQAEQNSEAAVQAPSRLEKVYLRIIEWGTYLLMLTPLILVRSFFFPYVSPKTIFFRIIVDILLIFYVLLVVSNRKYLPRFNALTVALCFFIGVTILTSITGVNFEKSFWSTFERMTGILTFLHLLIFFFILTGCFKERKYWERILTVAVLVGMILSFSTLVQKDPTGRGGGTIGNSSFLAAYLLFDIFFAITLFLNKKGGWRFLYLLALVPMLWLLLFSPYEKARAAIVSFWAGVILLGFGYLLFYLFTHQRRLLRKIAIGLIVLVILLGVGLYKSDLIQNKITEIGETGSMRSRIVVGEIGYKAWEERPWLGWGQENFNIAFAKYFNSKLFVPGYGGDVWYDRVHNIVLDVLVTSGALGLLSYLAIFIIAVFWLLKTLSRIVQKRNALLPLGMIVVLAVYFAQDLMVFDMISSYLMFFLTLGFCHFLIQTGKEAECEKKKGFPAALGAVLILLSLFTVYFGNIQPAKASRTIVRGLSQPLGESTLTFQKAIEASPMAIVEGPEQFSMMTDNLTFEEGIDEELLKEAFASSAEEMEKSIEKQPQDYRPYLLLGRHYMNFFYVTGDPEKNALAEEYLTKALGFSPENQQTYWSLAQVKLDQGKNGEAVDFMKQSIELAPDCPQSHWYLAMIYRAIGQNRLALDEVKAAEETGYNWKGSMEDLKKVITLYQNVEDHQEVANLYLLAIGKNPDNAQFYAGLAVAYANLGQFDKAREMAKKAVEIDPSFSGEIENFLNQLPQ